MSAPGLSMLACIGTESLERALLFSGALAEAGGTVVLLTYTPGLALRRTFFGLEVVVRHDEDFEKEVPRLLSLLRARELGLLFVDDQRLCHNQAAHGAFARLCSLAEVPVVYYGERWRAGQIQENLPCKVMDPYGEEGLCYVPIHPGLRPLREGRTEFSPEVERVVIACREDAVGRELSIHSMEALSVWRPTLQVTVLCEVDLPRHQKIRLTQAIEGSRHDVTLRPLPPWTQMGEALLADLAIVDDPELALLAAYLGTPCVLLTTSEIDGRRGEFLAKQGAAIHLPCLSEGMLPPALFADLIWSLFADQDRRRALFSVGRKVIDGYGAERVASALFEVHRGHEVRRGHELQKGE